jgi:hypothetical protein
MNKREVKRYIKSIMPDMEEVENLYEDEGTYKSIYLGSFMSLDPCGKYHHILSPNGATSRCEAFWERLERAANELNGWIETGEGDPTDIYFCMPV